LDKIYLFCRKSPSHSVSQSNHSTGDILPFGKDGVAVIMLTRGITATESKGDWEHWVLRPGGALVDPTGHEITPLTHRPEMLPPESSGALTIRISVEDRNATSLEDVYMAVNAFKKTLPPGQKIVVIFHLASD
jgi:hypothetical protein